MIFAGVSLFLHLFVCDSCCCLFVIFAGIGHQRFSFRLSTRRLLISGHVVVSLLSYTQESEYSRIHTMMAIPPPLNLSILDFTYIKV